MTLRLIVSKCQEQKRPAPPPIKRGRGAEEPRTLSEETKRRLIMVAVLRTKFWSN